MWVAQFLRDHLRLPSSQEVFAGGTPAEYGSLPQFGYLPHVLIGQFFPSSEFTFVSRFGSLVAGIPTVWAAFAVASELFSGSSFLIYALPLMIIFHPQLVFTQSYTNTDSTTTSLASIVIYLVVVSLKYGLTLRRAVLIGFLLGWTGLSKHTGLTITPAVGVGLLLSCYLNQTSLSQSIALLGAAASTFLATCGWWFVRNFYEFNGDFLGSKTMYETWAKILPRKDGKVVHPWPQLQTIGWWRFVFFDFWGLFGYMNRYLWRPVYIAYLAFVIIAVGSWLKQQKKPPDTTPEPVAPQMKAVWIFFLLCPLCNLIGMVSVTLMNVSGPHGRYLFPSEVAIFALILAGFMRLGERPGKVLIGLLLAINACVTIGSWLAFYRH